MSDLNDLNRRVHIQRRGDEDDGMGTVIPGAGPFETVWTGAARIQPMKGGEEFVAARLVGRQPVVVTVRRCAANQDMTPAWQVVDARTGRQYDVKSIANMDERDRFLEILAEA